MNRIEGVPLWASLIGLGVFLLGMMAAQWLRIRSVDPFLTVLAIVMVWLAWCVMFAVRLLWLQIRYPTSRFEVHAPTYVSPPMRIASPPDSSRTPRTADLAPEEQPLILWPEGSWPEAPTRATRRALAFAQEEAMRLNHTELGVEHLLLGILREVEGAGARLLFEHGAGLFGLRETVSHDHPRGTWLDLGDRAPAPHLRAVLAESVAAAHRVGSRTLGTGHLLAGVLAVSVVGRQLLRDAGVDVDGLSSAIERRMMDEDEM